VILSVNNITKLEVTNEYTRNITEVTSYVDQHYNNSQVINQLQQTSGDLDRKINSIFKILADAKIQELQSRKQYLQSKNTIGSRAMDFFVGTAQITSGNPFAILNGIRTIKDTITNNNNEEINDLETQINNLQNRKEEYEEETINMESLENDSNQFQAKDQAGSINENSLNNTRTSYFDTISTAGASIAGGLAGIWASTKGLTNLYDKITTKTNQVIATAQESVAKVFNKPKEYEKYSTSYKMQPGVKTGNIQDFNTERANYFHMNNYKDHHITNDVENGDSIRYLYKKYNYEDEIPSIRKAKNWYYGSYKRHPERYKLAGEDNENFKW
jgi:microcompartment protein CcmL/EutN